MATTSIKQVAETAGVSIGTVSNVLNRPEVVAPQTRARVQKAINELGFVRNESARQLRAGRSRLIGLVVLDVANPFFTDVARGVEAVADDHSMMVMLCNSGQDPKRELRHLEMLREQRVLGVLISPVDAQQPRLDDFVAQGVPVVLVDRGSGRGMCSVAVEDRMGGRLATRHLLEEGHSRIAFVGGPRSIRQVSERLAGARAEIAAAGLSKGSLVVMHMPALTVTFGRQAGAQLATLPIDARPTAVFCANDLLALGVLQEMTRRDLRVPDDVALIGYDDIEFAAAAAVPLSSVRQPREQLGETAAELMFDELEQPDRHRHRQVMFEPVLVVRGSSSKAVRMREIGVHTPSTDVAGVVTPSREDIREAAKSTQRTQRTRRASPRVP
jgi:LacI family transcriptional regulator